MLATAPSLLWSLPFVLLLACIALMPFIHRHFWEHHYGKIALALGLITAAYYFLIAPDVTPWFRSMEEYVSFIVLLGALFIISGGILIQVSRKATPLANCILLLFGAVVANIFGTTGASMLLIRPYLRMNQGHIRPYHVVFFIFLVSNCGGSLTPVGDPPLFLGYLNGVPFWWVLEHCWPAWALAVGCLLVVFFMFDTLDHQRQERHHDETGPAVGFLGIHNFLFILVVIAAVFQEGFFDVLHEIRLHGLGGALLVKLLSCRELLMIAATVASKLLTGRHIYERHQFSYAPIREVAILFIGIFSTMVPALQWLGANAHSLSVNTPGQYYFSAGALSSVLDNAPTYLTFLKLEMGKQSPEEVDQAMRELQRMSAEKSLRIDEHLQPESVRLAIQAVVDYHARDVLENTVTRDEVQVAFLIGQPMLNSYLIAISLGAVFFGACTYIGNGPNFMVKSIAESVGAETPGFIRYILVYTLPILLPVYILVWLIFLWWPTH